ncbi:MAG: Rpn family recombination-promoting nuclease/putative transposase [Treponema sp.]|nr:Rpn family recombination-promoting nuclease/putative transposase [Treponema sp.]
MPIHNTADNSFKRIFDDHRLFVDFIKDFIQIEILEDIKPEDIEDISERFLPLFQENRDADTVKRINLKGPTPLFVIAVLEHESKVNYRSCFKMLQYICLVLDAWEKEAEKEKPGSSLLKDFKYPPVLPMIFYDGKGDWTAQRNFFDRTHLNQVFEKYIPKFEYELINLNDYSEEEIMRFGGALSYIFLIDKIRNSREKERINRLPDDYVERLRLQIPDDMIKLLTDVTLSLLDKSGHNRNEAEAVAAIIEKAEGKEYGGMFEAAIESLREEREEAWAEGHAEGMEKGREKGREDVLRLLEQGLSAEEIKLHLEQKLTGA